MAGKFPDKTHALGKIDFLTEPVESDEMSHLLQFQSLAIEANANKELSKFLDLPLVLFRDILQILMDSYTCNHDVKLAPLLRLRRVNSKPSPSCVFLLSPTRCT
jgi:hypothetical protein